MSTDGASPGRTSPERTSPGRMTPSRRELTVAVLLCLLGAALVLVAAGNPWSRVDVAATGLADARTVEVTGDKVVPGVRALGLVGLAGVVALAATRRTGRTVVGLVLAVVGAGVVAAVLGADSGPALLAKAAEGGGQAGDVLSGTGWPAVTVTGGVMLALAGVVVAARGRRWAALSARYDAPAARAHAPSGAPSDAPADEQATGSRQERALWEALDRGEDPTQRSS